MSRRHSRSGAAGPNNPAGVPGKARAVGKAGWSAAESRSRRCHVSRKAIVAFNQRSEVDMAKTAIKRAAFVAKIVQKTSTYPMVENHAQSTTKSLAYAATMRQTTMTAMGTPMRFQGMFPPRRPFCARNWHRATL